MKQPRHAENSIIYSADDHSGPNDFLIDLGMASSIRAWETPVYNVNMDLEDSKFFNVYPGEHYRLIKSIVALLEPKLVVEVGTYTGMGTLALMQGNNAPVHTFDIIAWDKFKTHLTPEMFETRVTQHISDLSDPKEFEKHRNVLNAANIIFLDAPKDGQFEPKFMELLKTLDKKENRLLIIDDIKVMNMVSLWFNITYPKLDLTSFGHWSGTGLVDLSNPD